MRLLLLVSRESIWVDLRLGQALLGEEFIDARGVFRAPDLWFVRHFVFFLLDHIPVNVREEGMLLQVSSVILGTNTL